MPAEIYVLFLPKWMMKVSVIFTFQMSGLWTASPEVAVRQVLAMIHIPGILQLAVSEAMICPAWPNAMV